MAVSGVAATSIAVPIAKFFDDWHWSHDRHDAVAVAFSVRGASQPAEEAADSDDDRVTSQRAEEEAPEKEAEFIAARHSEEDQPSTS